MFELTKWEYKVIPIKTRIHSDHFEGGKKPVMEDVQNDLNSLGKEDWELVSVQDISLQDGRRFTVAYLKRHKGST
jgi:ribosomal protein S24E